MIRTQVAIIGAGPAGLTLAHLLGLEGIESVVLERHTRDYVETRTRAGLLEQGTVDLLRATGAGERVAQLGDVHEGFELCFDEQAHHVSTMDLVGAAICMYPQQEVVKDLIRARVDAGSEPFFGVTDVTIDQTDSTTVHGVHNGVEIEIQADFVAGCDGFHGISRKMLPNHTTFEQTFPFGWLGILADAPPVSRELVYNCHDRGFTLHSMRTPRISRQYLQVHPSDTLADWPDDRIWAELATRLGPRVTSGPVLEKSITTMRSFVTEPMQHGRLFLAGDSAHIVPPTAAKGLNLAVSDARHLAEALTTWYSTGNREPLDGYTRTCLRDIWLAQDFSVWMTHLLHTSPTDTPFDVRRRHARLRHMVESPTAARSFAEHYTGMARVLKPV